MLRKELLVAAQFEAGHWVRVAGAAATAMLSFVGLLRCHRIPVAPGPDTP